jgi:transposase
MANWASADLTRINGLGAAAVMKILSGIGPDLSRFANVKHFCSWLGLCPGTKISGGKVLSAKTKGSAPNRVRQTLKMAAMSLSHSGSALGAFYRWPNWSLTLSIGFVDVSGLGGFWSPVWSQG